MAPQETESRPALLSVRNLSVEFASPSGAVTATDDVSFDLFPGEVLGLAGESGAGKSVTGSAIINLIPRPGRIKQGQVYFNGTRIDNLPERQMRKIRGAQIGMTFQDASSALDPLFTIGDQIAETIAAHKSIGAAATGKRAMELLQELGLPDHAMTSYPHQLSGGMRQRAVIALALASEPALLIADEPPSALDVSSQAVVIESLARARKTYNMAILFISHDIAVLAGIADRIAVIYAGRIVETGPIKKVLSAPWHPYTQGLIEAVPQLHHAGGQLKEIPGVTPRGASMEQGCAFRARCTRRIERCGIERPPLRQSEDRQVACWLDGLAGGCPTIERPGEGS